MSDDTVWFEWVRSEDLSERHTGLTARVGPLEGDAVVGTYEDRGYKFLVGDSMYSKSAFDTIQIESVGENDGLQIVSGEASDDG